METEGRRSDEQPIAPNIHSKESYLSHFKFNKDRDSADQVRNALLVVAALVAAASYQAVMSPPDGFKDKPPLIKLIFLYANTLAWSSSGTLIEMLTDSFPFQIELRLSLLSMGFAYGVIAASLVGTSSGVAYVLLILDYSTPFLVRKAVTYSNC